ncbi:MAG: transposase [Gammaproteobacteria bacterium]|nr:transposase [Gammaproteobacteria bacterium]
MGLHNQCRRSSQGLRRQRRTTILPPLPKPGHPTGCWPQTSASQWTAEAASSTNIFIERLWRSLRYEAVYLHELRDGLDAEQIIGTWVDFYNDVRPHSSLGGRTPGEVYRDGAIVS